MHFLATLCYPHVPLGQKINPVRVGLIGLCSEDCDGDLVYEWTIFGVDRKTGKDVLLKEASEFVVGATEQKMALGKEFFDQYYPKYGDFFAKLSVTNTEGDRGESDIFLHINQPPVGGECIFMPLNSMDGSLPRSEGSLGSLPGSEGSLEGGITIDISTGTSSFGGNGTSANSTSSKQSGPKGIKADTTGKVDLS